MRQRSTVSAGRDGEVSEVGLDARDAAERNTLRWVLGINMVQVLVAGAVGIAAESTGLLGAALDNLADAGVYVVSLYAVGRSVVAKSRAARLSGVLLILLGLAVLLEVIRRYVTGSEPVGLAMILTAIANAATNLINLRLLRSHREGGVHLKASWIFTSNDMLVNAGVVVSGVAVMVFASRLPDLVIGLVLVGIVVKGGWEILEEASSARRASASGADERPRTRVD